MNVDIIIMLCPAFPVLAILIMIIHYRDLMKNIGSEEQQDREAHRSYILVMAGFSFTGLLGVAVAGAAIQNSFQNVIYFLFISFLSYLVALNMQAYKAEEWKDLLATSLMDSASLSLILSIISVLLCIPNSVLLHIILPALAVLVWFLDWFIRYRIHWQHLQLQKTRKGRK